LAQRLTMWLMMLRRMFLSSFTLHGVMSVLESERSYTKLPKRWIIRANWSCCWS